jgi:hypothetical protein
MFPIYGTGYTAIQLDNRTALESFPHRKRNARFRRREPVARQ